MNNPFYKTTCSTPAFHLSLQPTKEQFASGLRNKVRNRVQNSIDYIALHKQMSNGFRYSKVMAY